MYMNTYNYTYDWAVVYAVRAYTNSVMDSFAQPKEGISGG